MQSAHILYKAWQSLQDARNVNPNVDEVALLFHSSAALDAFLRDMPGTAEVFNRVPCDIMRRQDMLGSFQVRFEFVRLTAEHTLRFPHSTEPWRIEAMCVLEGDAPLHRQKIAMSEELPCVVHWSYKLPNLDAYQAAVRAHRSAGDVMRAEYLNSYGMFSYFGSNGAPYMKPRVNLRDTAIVQDSSACSGVDA